MAVWGTESYWGLDSYWGTDTGNSGEEFCEIANDRVLGQHPDPGPFRDLICDLVFPLGHYKDVALDVQQAFDLANAKGEQLDFIGRLVDLPRQGFNDDRYRVFLEIQTQLVLSVLRDPLEWTGTAPNLIKIARTFIGDAVVDPVVYTGAPPYAYVLSVPGIADIDELNLLVSFLCKATYAGVLGNIKFALAEDSKWSSIHGPVTGDGIYCSIHGAVASCAIYGHLVLIGIEPC